MNDSVLVGHGKDFSRVHREDWKRHLAGASHGLASRLAFMSEDHRMVRNFAVVELPRLASPLAPTEIARTLGIPLSRTLEILTDLERHLFFLVRNTGGDVSWAFPVTVDSTGHGLTFSTGERLDAA